MAKEYPMNFEEFNNKFANHFMTSFQQKKYVYE